MDHRLKSWPQFFEATRKGPKRFEVRKNDRNYNVGDTLTFFEWDPEKQDFTGEMETGFRVVYLLKNCPGIEPGYCVMGIER